MEKEPTFEEKVKFVASKIGLHGYGYCNELTEKNIDPVYILYKHNKLTIDKDSITDGMICNFFGLYYVLQSDYDKAIDFYDLGYKLGNTYCFYNKVYFSKRFYQQVFNSMNLQNDDYTGNDDMMCLAYGDFYITNTIHRNIERGYEFMKRGVDAGGKWCTFFLAHYYYENWIPRDYTKAFQLFSKAAEYNIAYAIRSVGYYYVIGEHIERDIEKGLELVEKAADMFDFSAYELLATWYGDGSFGVTKDIEKSVLWCGKLISLSPEKYGSYVRVVWRNDEMKALELCDKYNIFASLFPTLSEKTTLVLEKMYNKDKEKDKVIMELKNENNELKQVNEHLKLFPGTSYEQAMKDYELLSVLEAASI